MAIDEHNARADAGYLQDVNQFTGADMSLIMKESSGLKSFGKTIKCPNDAPEFSTQIPVIEKSWDYRDINIKSPVRDQGFQGLGQVHASISAIEQHYQNKYSLLTKRFSAQ